VQRSGDLNELTTRVSRRRGYIFPIVAAYSSASPHLRETRTTSVLRNDYSFKVRLYPVTQLDLVRGQHCSSSLE